MSPARRLLGVSDMVCLARLPAWVPAAVLGRGMALMGKQVMQVTHEKRLACLEVNKLRC